MFCARKLTSLPFRSRTRSCPSTEISPLVGYKRPAMIEISVVLPQPEGPTSSVVSPRRTSRSTPLRATVFVSPLPNSLVTPRQTTAGERSNSNDMVLSSKYDGGFQDEHFANAEEAGDNDDQHHCRSDAAEGQRCHRQPRQVCDAAGRFKECRGQANANAIADEAHDHRLEQDHADQPGVAHAHGLQRA